MPLALEAGPGDTKLVMARSVGSPAPGPPLSSRQSTRRQTELAQSQRADINTRTNPHAVPEVMRALKGRAPFNANLDQD